MYHTTCIHISFQVMDTCLGDIKLFCYPKPLGLSGRCAHPVLIRVLKLYGAP